MKAKVEIYLEKKKQLEKEYTSITKKIEKLKSTGTSDKSIQKLYPDFEDLKCFAIELGELIDLVRTRGREANETSVKTNLIEAIEDPDEGLASIVGRENLKNK